MKKITRFLFAFTFVTIFIVNKNYTAYSSEISIIEIPEFEENSNYNVTSKDTYTSSVSTADIKLYINNQLMDINDDILILNDHSYFPLRNVGVSFMCDVFFDDNTKSVTIANEKNKLVFTANSNIFYVNDIKKTLEDNTFPIIFNDKMYMPIKCLAENLNYSVTYDENTKSVFCNFSLKDDYNLILVNKNHNLSKDFVPEELTYISIPRNKEMSLTKSANDALNEMYESALKDNIHLYAVSAYRTYDYQNSLYNNSVKNRGVEYTNKYILKGGQSEHQTGLAIDITSKSNDYLLTENFINTPEYKWLKENCYKFGFILRYPKESHSITEINFEPWHYRYIGDTEKAKYIMENNICLEEYLEKF